MTTQTCIIDGCIKPATGRMCPMHKSRWYRFGTTADRGFQGTSEERYERSVTRGDGCWGWSGSTNERGYGRIGVRYAHRISWEIHRGPIPSGLWVLHRCDNPPCTNPDHLFLGTHAENMADANAKGRLLGSPSKGHKLTREEASEIRCLRASGWTRRQVSERFGIHMDNVTEITSGRMWRDA